MKSKQRPNRQGSQKAPMFGALSRRTKTGKRGETSNPTGEKSLPAWRLKPKTTSNALPDSGIRIVLDTNVLIAAAFARSPYVEEIINLALTGHVRIIISPFIIKELQRKLVDKFGYPKPQAEAFVQGVGKIGKFVSDTAMITARLTDPDDYPIIATALNGKAQLIVTKDRILLRQKQYGAIGIIDPSTLRHIFPNFFK